MFIMKIQDGCLLYTTGEGPTRLLVSVNINLDTKIMSLSAQEQKIWHFLHFNGGHFEIQDGC